MAEDRWVHGQKYLTWGKWDKQHLNVIAALYEHIGRVLRDCADAGVITPDNARQLAALANALEIEEDAFQAIAEELLR